LLKVLGNYVSLVSFYFGLQNYEKWIDLINTTT
jgi:hypothetical protein